MRSTRIAKYRRKHRKLIISSQVMIMLYALLVSITLLSSSTVAHYSDRNNVHATISSASDWWDGSKLMFVEKETEVIHSCTELDLRVEIKNVASDMSKSTNFEIYFSEQTDNLVEEHGDLIVDGEISPLLSDQVTVLTYQASEEGWYVFKAYQRAGYNQNYDERTEIWSHQINVQCNEEQQSESTNEKEERENIEGSSTNQEMADEEQKELPSERDTNEQIEEEQEEINDEKEENKEMSGNDGNSDEQPKEENRVGNKENDENDEAEE